MGSKNDVSTLAHEIGHSQHSHGRAGKFWGANRRLDQMTRNTATQKYAGGVGLLTGFASGYNQTKNDDDSKVKKLAAYTPTMINAPMILEEADASRRGLKLMRNAGASKAQLMAGRKSLGLALGTYMIRPAAQIGMTAVGRVAGKTVGKMAKKKEEQAGNLRAKIKS